MFDHSLHRRHKERAQHRMRAVDFLAAEGVQQLIERLQEITRPLQRVLVVGAYDGIALRPLLQAFPTVDWVVADMHSAPLQQVGCTAVQCSADALPFAHNVFDAVLVLGALHWAQDVIGALVQLRLALKDDGLLLAVLPGARSLYELRAACTEVAIASGGAPHLIPLMDVRDAGNVLQRAGFALPVVDSELLSASYASPRQLWQELRHMGEANALERRSVSPRGRAYWHAIATAYHQQFADAEGRVPATFEMLVLTAWKPAIGQPQPAKRGSGTVPLGQALNS